MSSGMLLARPSTPKDFWQPLGEVELGAAASQIDFATISQAYRTLKLQASLRGDTVATFVGLLMSLNNDTADANYSRQYLQASANVAPTGQESIGGANSRQAGLIAAASAPAGFFTHFELTIVNYASATKIKPARISVGAYGLATGTSIVRESVITRNNQAAIDRITLSVGTGNFAAGSIASLWGIKAPF